MEDKFLNGRGLKEYTAKVKEKMAFIEDPTTSGLPLSLVNLFYPVGSYYETSSTTFDPNTAWGGTWVKDSAGRVTVSQDTTQTEFDTIGETGGSKEITLTGDNIPRGQFAVAHVAQMEPEYYASGIVTHDRGTVGDTEEGAVSSVTRTYEHRYTFGKNPPDNIKVTQPYVVVVRWHRTA